MNNAKKIIIKIKNHPVFTYMNNLQHRILGDLTLIEYICIIGPLYLFIAYQGQFKELLQIFQNKASSFFLIFWIIISLAFICLFHTSKSRYTSKKYAPETYATLRSERDEYTIAAGISSLASFMFKEIQPDNINEMNLSVIFTAFYILILLCISYRHLSYAIYMQEAKKNSLHRISIEHRRDNWLG